MKKLLFIVFAAASMIGVSVRADIDYIGNRAETVREENLRRHQQEMLSGKKKSGKQKPGKRKVNKSSKQTRSTQKSVWKKETNLPASRLRVGDVIHAARSGNDTIVFKSGAVRVASLAPLTLNFNNTMPKTAPKGTRTPMGNFAVITSTGRPSGVIGFMTFDKPDSVKFTRLSK